MEFSGLIPSPDRLRKVLIVGAGVSGLQCARQFLKLGCNVLVLELNEDLGGVWLRNYSGFGLQVPWKLYQFPEFPWPKEMQPRQEYPTGEEVQEYARAYATHFDLRRHIRFNCKLLRLRWCPNIRSWEALYCDTSVEKFYKVVVDYAIICAGIYSQPYIPDYEGTDSYAGIQLHAKDFTDLSLARGRRVVIVGAGKTALDCVGSIVATSTAASVTLLYRQAHWPLPRRMLGTSVRRLMFNRAMTGMMAPYYTASAGKQLAARASAPLKKLFWRSVESLIGSKFRITEHLRPRVHLPEDLFYGGQILDNTMDKLIRAEALNTVKGEINRFVRNGVILQDGSFVAADLVLYCTGYLKTYDYLDGDMRARLDLQKDGLYLYRNCLPYAVPHLAFIGSEVSTYNNILTQGLQALWLAHVLTGRLQLPSPADMAEDVRAQQRWRRAIMPAQRSRGSVLMLYMMQYHDQLLEDMGARPRRKGLNVFAECFGTYSAHDYKDLLEADPTVSAAMEAEQRLMGPGMQPPFRGSHGNRQDHRHNDGGDYDGDGHGSGAYGHAANGHGSGAGPAPGRHGQPATPRGNAGSGSYAGTYSSMGQPGSSGNGYGDTYIGGNAAAVAAASAASASAAGSGNGAAPASAHGTMLAVYAQRAQQDGYEYHRALMGERVGSGANSGSGGVTGLRTMSMSLSRGAGSMTASKRPASGGMGLAGRQLSMSKGLLAPLAALMTGSPHNSFRRSIDNPHGRVPSALALGGSGAPSASGSFGSRHPSTRPHTVEGFYGLATAPTAVAAGLAGARWGPGESPRPRHAALHSAVTAHEAAGLTAGGRLHLHASTTHGESAHSQGTPHADSHLSPRAVTVSGKSASTSEMFLMVQQQLRQYNQQHHPPQPQDHSRTGAMPASAHELHHAPPPAVAHSAPGRSRHTNGRAPPSPQGQHEYRQHSQGQFSSMAVPAECSQLPSLEEMELRNRSAGSAPDSGALRGSQLVPLLGATDSGCAPMTGVHTNNTAFMYTGGAPTVSPPTNCAVSGGAGGFGSAGVGGGNSNGTCGFGGSASRLSLASSTSRNAQSPHASLGHPAPQSPVHSHSRLSRNTLATSPLLDVAGGHDGHGSGSGMHRPSQCVTEGGHQNSHSASLPCARSSSVGGMRTSQPLPSCEGMGSGAVDELMAEGEFVVVGPMEDDVDMQDELQVGEAPSKRQFSSTVIAVTGGAGAAPGVAGVAGSTRRTAGRLPPPSPSSGFSRFSRLGEGVPSRHTLHTGRGSTGGMTPYDSSNSAAAAAGLGNSTSNSRSSLHSPHQQHLQQQLPMQQAYASHAAIASHFDAGRVAGLAGQGSATPEQEHEHPCPPDSPFRSGTPISHRTTEADGGGDLWSGTMPSSCKNAVSACGFDSGTAHATAAPAAAASDMYESGASSTGTPVATMDHTCLQRAEPRAGAMAGLQQQPTLRQPPGGQVTRFDSALSTQACASEPSNRLSISSRTSFDSRPNSLDVVLPPSAASIPTGPGDGSGSKAAATAGRTRLAGTSDLMLRTGGDGAEQRQWQDQDGEPQLPVPAQPLVDELAGGAPVTPPKAQAAVVDIGGVVGAGGFLEGSAPTSSGYGEPTMAMSGMMMRAHSIPSTVSNGASSTTATGSGIIPFGSAFPSESAALQRTGSSSVAGQRNGSDSGAPGARALLPPGSRASSGAASALNTPFARTGPPSAGRSSKRSGVLARHVSGGLGYGGGGALALAVVPPLVGGAGMVPASPSGGSGASSACVLASRSSGGVRLQPGSGSPSRLHGMPMLASAPRFPAAQEAVAGAGEVAVTSYGADNNSNVLQLSNLTLGGWDVDVPAGAGGSSLMGLSGGICHAAGIMSLSRVESLSSRDEAHLGAEVLGQ